VRGRGLGFSLRVHGRYRGSDPDLGGHTRNQDGAARVSGSLVNDCPDNGNQYEYHHDETNQAQHVNDSELGQGPDDVSLDQ
jgi:hypothetical protein